MIKESIFSFLKIRKMPIIIFTGIVVIFGILFYLYDIPFDAISYGCELSFVWCAVCLFIDFYKYYKRHKLLHINREQFFDDAEQLPEHMDIIEYDYQELAKELYQAKQELISKNRIAKKELLDYYGMWVHQIKTPIAALGVLIQSGEELEEVQESPKAQELTRSMKMEVFRIEQYVDMVLTYLRMGSATSDYAFRICSLEEIVRQAVRKYSQMFIMTRTKLHLEIQDQKILTDEKWLTFVIEQILSNAVKYARGGEISIYTEDKTLVIADDGIGIAEEDLPRIFEKGFTGYNGRANKKSTGIGLYLCKTIIDRLHHTIWIESKPEKGTKVYLNFDREHRRIE